MCVRAWCAQTVRNVQHRWIVSSSVDHSITMGNYSMAVDCVQMFSDLLLLILTIVANNNSHSMMSHINKKSP